MNKPYTGDGLQGIKYILRVSIKSYDTLPGLFFIYPLIWIKFLKRYAKYKGEIVFNNK